MADRTMSASLRRIRSRLTRVERRLAVRSADLPDRLGPVGQEVTDWNDAVRPGFYWSANGASNAPGPGDWQGVVTVSSGGVVIQNLVRQSSSLEVARQTMRRIGTEAGAFWFDWAMEGAETISLAARGTNVQSYVRVATLDGVNASNGANVILDFYGGLNFGRAEGYSGRLHLAQRGSNVISLRVWTEGYYSEDPAQTPLWYTRQISEFVFELWVGRPAYSGVMTIRQGSLFRGQMLGDGETETAPSGLVAANTVTPTNSASATLPLLSGFQAYDANRTPRFRIADGGIQLSGLVRAVTGTMNGTLQVAQLPYTLSRSQMNIVTPDSSSVVRILANTNGRLDLYLSTPANWVYLDGAFFWL